MKFTLSMGISAIPVTAMKGSEDIDFKRSEYDGQGRKIGRAQIVKDSDPLEVLETTHNVIKVVEHSNGLVPISNDEINDLDFGVEKETAKILAFVGLKTLGTAYMPEGSVWQVRPVKNDKGAARAYAALLKAMRRRGSFALVEYCYRERPYFAALLGNGSMYKLRFEEEIREEAPLPDERPSDDQMRVADVMIETMTPTDLPVLSDRFTEIIWDYINTKAENQENFLVRYEDRPEVVAARGETLMASLLESVESIKAKRAEAPAALEDAGF